MNKLLTIPFSHFCEKARWALDRAGVPYEETGHLPFLHMLPVWWTGGQRTVPLLVTSDGTIGDSTDILKWVETQKPGSLYPEPHRAEIEALEDRFDQALGPASRRVAYFHLLPHRSVTVPLMKPGSPAWEHRVMQVFYPFAVVMMRRGMKIDAAGAERSLQKLEEVFLEVETRLSDGRRFLVGDRFTAADLSLAALASPVLAPPENDWFHPDLQHLPDELRKLMEAYRARPAGQFVLRLYAEFRK